MANGTSFFQISVEGSFRYLWIKYIIGVDLKEHCAKCLLGEYDPRIRATLRHASDIALAAAPFYYLCGVTQPYCRAKNFHLAFREKKSYILRVRRKGISIEIQDTEEVKFSEADIAPDDPHIRLTAYRTCRNWQFAHKVKSWL